MKEEGLSRQFPSRMWGGGNDEWEGTGHDPEPVETPTKIRVDSLPKELDGTKTSTDLEGDSCSREKPPVQAGRDDGTTLRKQGRPTPPRQFTSHRGPTTTSLCPQSPACGFGPRDTLRAKERRVDTLRSTSPGRTPSS